MINNEKYITVPREEYESMKATIETLQDKEVMQQLKKSQGAPSKSLEKLREELED